MYETPLLEILVPLLTVGIPITIDQFIHFPGDAEQDG